MPAPEDTEGGTILASTHFLLANRRGSTSQTRYEAEHSPPGQHRPATDIFTAPNTASTVDHQNPCQAPTTLQTTPPRLDPNPSRTPPTLGRAERSDSESIQSSTLRNDPSLEIPCVDARRPHKLIHMRTHPYRIIFVLLFGLSSQATETPHPHFTKLAQALESSTFSRSIAAKRLILAVFS